MMQNILCSEMFFFASKISFAHRELTLLLERQLEFYSSANWTLPLRNQHSFIHKQYLSSSILCRVYFAEIEILHCPSGK